MKLEIFKSTYGYYNLRTSEGHPTEEMVSYLKENGYRWSRNYNCWYPATNEAKEANLHDDFVIHFKEEFFPEVAETIKTDSEIEQQPATAVTQTDNKNHLEDNKDTTIAYLKDLILQLQEERKKDQEKIEELTAALTESRHTAGSFPSDQKEVTPNNPLEAGKNDSNDESSSLENEGYVPHDRQNPEYFSKMLEVTPEIMNELYEEADNEARNEAPEVEKSFGKIQESSADGESVTPDELEAVKTVLPMSQYVLTLRLSQGEEGEFYAKKIKDLAKLVKEAPGIGDTDGMEQHPVILRYFHPTGTETLVTEIGQDGEAFGFQCLNGDYQMAEWGYIDLNEVRDIRMMEVDYYIDPGMTVERWLYKEQPDMFPEYAVFASRNEKTPFDIANETGNDVEAISESLSTSPENNEEYARELADWIIQHGLEMSIDMENFHVSFVDILEYTDTPENWLNDPANIQLVNDALAEHDDNELLDYNPDENEPGEFNLYFCSNSDEMGENTLFKQDQTGRWVRKTDEELQQELRNRSFSYQSYEAGSVEKEKPDNINNTDPLVYDFTKPIDISAKFAIAFFDRGRSENVVCFIDKEHNNQITTGQYLVSTFADRKSDKGLMLDQDVPDWKVDSESMKKVQEICRHYRDNKITDTCQRERITDGKTSFLMPLTPQQLKTLNDRYSEAKEEIKTDFVLEKLAAAGIEVVQDKEEFNRILLSEKLFQKITVDSKIQKMTSSEYYNKEVDAFVTDKSGFVDPEKIAAIDLYGFEKAKEMWKDGEPDWKTRMMLQDKSISDYLNQRRTNIYNYKLNNEVYGFAYENKIYLNPDIMTSEVAAHEYTHLWDSYTQRTNPELWQKGKEIFRNTRFWQDVKSDPNYSDIADNDDLLLSEVHAQICGKMADEILNRIAERDGELTKDTVIDWDKESWNYIATEIGFRNFVNIENSMTREEFTEFFSKPMKDLMNGLHITNRQDPSYKINGQTYRQKEIEKLLGEDIQNIFQELTPEPHISGVRLYQDPEKNNRINLLVQYSTNPAEGSWREDDLFNIIADEKLLFNGMEVDVNPITPEKSGTIEEYLSRLQNLGVTNEADAIKKQAEAIETSEKEKKLRSEFPTGKTEFSASKLSKAELKEIREKCREILLKNDSDITEEEKRILSRYEGGGGLEEKDRSADAVLNEFYTPDYLIDKVWQLVDSYAPEAVTVLEPSAGTGKFADNRPGNSFTMHELDETSARINAILHPDAKVIQGPYQKQFFDENGIARLRWYVPPKYDVVIGNPPYGKYMDEWHGKGEGKDFDRYEEYFIAKGLESLKDKDSLLAFVIPSGFINSAKDRQKELLVRGGFHLVDAWRLPEGTFPTTEVGTDIIIVRNRNFLKGTEKKYDEEWAFNTSKEDLDLISGGKWFSEHPDRVLGEIRTRKNRFGREEEYVTVHEGSSVLDELDKIRIPGKEKKVQKEVSLQNTVPYVVAAYNAVVNNKESDTLSSKVSEISKVRKLDLDKISDWRNFLKYYFNNQIVIDIKTRESVLFHESYGHNPFIIAEADSNGIIRTNYNVNSEAYRKLTPTQKKKLNDAVQDYKDKLDSVLHKYLGYDEKSEKFYFRDCPSNIPRFISNINFYNPETGEYINAENSNCMTSAFGIEISHSGNEEVVKTMAGDYDYNSVQKGYTSGPFFATFDTIYSGEPDLARINRDNEMINQNIMDSARMYPVNENFTSELNNENYARQEVLKLQEMLRLSGIDKEEWGKKAFGFYKDYEKNKSKIQAEHQSAVRAEEDANLVLNDILGLPFDKKISFVAGASEVSFLPEKGNTVIWIDDKKAFSINENLKKLTTFNNYYVTVDFVRALYERYGELTVSDEVFLEKEKESLDKIISEKIKPADGNICRDLSSFLIEHINNSNDEKEPVKGTFGGNTVTMSFGGINTTVFIGEHNDTLLKFNKKNNILSLFQASFDNGMTAYLEQDFRNAYGNISVIKDISIEGINYSDASGRTIIKPEYKNSSIQAAEDKVLLTNKEFSSLYGVNWNPEERVFWEVTDYENYVDLSKLSPEQIQKLRQSDNYFEESKDRFIHKVMFLSGDIYQKIDKNEYEFHSGSIEESSYKKNKEALEKSIPVPFTLEEISPPVKSAFVRNMSINNIPLQEMFFQWATRYNIEDSSNTRNEIEDFTQASISREDIPADILWSDVVDYIDGNPVKVDGNIDEESKRNKIRSEKMNSRKKTAENLFQRFLREGLTKEQQDYFIDSYNRNFNYNREPDYSKLPLFVEGMNRYRNGEEFTLYEQQLKGVASLSNKGNGLLAYDVGVGKTAAGIVATVNQIQTARSSRPLIMVPKSVIKSWEHDIRELFPDYTLNVLGNFSWKNIEPYYDGNHGLNIPPESITLCTHEALSNIAFKKETIKDSLFYDYADLLGQNDNLKNENPRKRAEAMKKILDSAGASAAVKNPNYVFFENTGFDHITVDEAHRFKNLFKVPRPKKGETNEFAVMGTGDPSRRAMKMFSVTQYIQKNNNDRNVFMLTATPFTNSPLEIYSMLSYIARKELEKQGLKDLYSFCEQYANTSFEQVVTHKNTIEYASVMKEFNDVGSLQNTLKKFIDKVDAEEALVIRPDKKNHPVYLQPTPLQLEMFEFAHQLMNYTPQADEEKRAPVLEGMNIINKAALSPALLREDQLIDPYSKGPSGIVIPGPEEVVTCSPKLKTTCDTVVSLWKEHPDCGQIIYMNIGNDFFPEIENYMKKQGVPAEVFAIITGQDTVMGDKNVPGNSDEARDNVAQAFNDIKNPCKIIIGSSAISEGMNLNGNSIALYNLTLGWNPSESIQVTGRIHRQGNKQGKVHIVYPLLEDSCDPFLFQKHDEKSSRINSLFDYKAGSTMNVEEIKPEEAKFSLIKNPRTLTDFEIQKDVTNLEKEKIIYESQLKDYDRLVTNRIKFDEKLKKRSEEKATYISNYQKNLFSGNSRTEEEQKKGEARFDKSINECKIMLKNINSKLKSMGIVDDKDAQNFSLAISKKIDQTQGKIDQLKSPENIMKVQKKWEMRLLEERILKKNRAHTGHLSESISNDLVPFEVTEERVQTERWDAAQKYRISDPERFRKAEHEWNKYLDKKSKSHQEESSSPSISDEVVVKEVPVKEKEAPSASVREDKAEPEKPVKTQEKQKEKEYQQLTLF